MNIIKRIDTKELRFDDSFSVAMYCSKLLATGKAEDAMVAREIVIHILNNWSNMDRYSGKCWILSLY